MNPTRAMSFFDDLRKPLRLVLVFSLVVNLALLAPAIFMLQVFDRVLSTRSVETLVLVGLIALSLLLLMGVLDYLRSQALTATSIRIEQRHGPRMLQQLLAMSARQGGAGYADGMRDLATMRGFLSSQGTVALCDAPWTLIYLGLIYLFHPMLGLLATGCTIALLVLAVLNERLSRQLVGQLHEGGRQMARFVDDALRQSESVTALGMAPAVTRRWDRLALANRRLQLKLTAGAGRITSASKVARQAIQVLMLGTGAWLVIHDLASPGVMLATTIILTRALAPVEMLIAGWKGLIDARGALDRLRSVVERPDEGAVVTELPRPSGRLSAEGLVYAPPGAERPLLQGVSLDVQPGQVLAVVGPSGSGKTTLVRLLCGVLPPTHGSVRFDGADIRAWDPRRLGAWVGYVPQDVALFESTVSENIARMGEVDAAAVLQAAQRAQAHEMILRLSAGYDTQVGAGGGRLSGGQRQRVALARALYGDPALVLLDEPDAHLDADGEQALLEVLRGLKARGVTVVVVSQRRAVLTVADGVLVMRDGAVERVANIEPPPARATAAAVATTERRV